MVPRSNWSTALEISDLLVDFDPVTHERRPVRLSDVEAALGTTGDFWGIRQVRRIPTTNGILDDGFVDRLLVQVHSELSRLGQELAQPARMLSLLRPLIHIIRGSGHNGPIRVVDLGCGAGYTTRWLTRHGQLGADVELVGCDYNAALVAEAQRLADKEGLRCSFQVANAFALREPATIITSAGVLHHFRGNDLRAYFAAHDPATVRGYIHYDTTPSRPFVRYLGAWVFHIARMRLALSRHDGVISAMRSHDDATLAQCALQGSPWAAVNIFEPAGTRSLLVNVMRPVIGLAPPLEAPFRSVLGKRAQYLVPAAELARGLS
jgi:SAM-dependent methyltransferase